MHPQPRAVLQIQAASFPSPSNESLAAKSPNGVIRILERPGYGGDCASSLRDRGEGSAPWTAGSAPAALLDFVFRLSKFVRVNDLDLLFIAGCSHSVRPPGILIQHWQTAAQ